MNFVYFLQTRPAFEIRPFRLSETTNICGGQSIVTMGQPTFEEDIFTSHYYLKAFISEVTVRVEQFYYSGELPLAG